MLSNVPASIKGAKGILFWLSSCTLLRSRKKYRIPEYIKMDFKNIKIFRGWKNSGLFINLTNKPAINRAITITLPLKLLKNL